MSRLYLLPAFNAMPFFQHHMIACSLFAPSEPISMPFSSASPIPHRDIPHSHSLMCQRHSSYAHHRGHSAPASPIKYIAACPCSTKATSSLVSLDRWTPFCTALQIESRFDTRDTGKIESSGYDAGHKVCSAGRDDCRYRACSGASEDEALLSSHLK
jgi:hypothetical protein